MWDRNPAHMEFGENCRKGTQQTMKYITSEQEMLKPRVTSEGHGRKVSGNVGTMEFVT